ncbi:MAG: Gfo/Idh/MocA family oxidoreductase [Desulfocapsaceae bacterium]|jgi:predicted dehydrogenase|nr:Gfo/Idh/MocA family oxidoreductase [Desulfocapsaceae bacterium]
MRIGIIGTGRHGSRYANHIVHDCDALHLTEIARRSEEGVRQADSWGARYRQDWRELVASADVEAVICAVPPVLNSSIAEQCSKYKKPLLIEKPLSVNAVAGRKIVTMMNQAEVPLTVGQTLRYNPVVRKLREELPNQGKLYTAYANQRLEPSDISWLENPQEAGAGITVHIAVHVFDALHYITGLKVVRVSAMCRTCRTKHLEDLALIHVEMENGVAGIVDVSKLSTSRSGRYEFICEKSQLHGDQVHGYVNCISANVERRLEKFPPVPTVLGLLNDWQRFLTGDGPNPVSGEDGLYALRVSEASLESAEDSRWVNV